MREAKHSCGLFGIFNHPDAAALTHLALHAQQHRGQEAAGICTTNGTDLYKHAGLGLVSDVFNADNLAAIKNPTAIGHVRYSTTGSCTTSNTQPFRINIAETPIAIAHNGNLTNAIALRTKLENQGIDIDATSDTEIIGHLLASTGDPRLDSIASCLRLLEGAYCLVILFPDRILAIRDPLGFRPLCIGQFDTGSYVVASETCAFDVINAEYIRDVEPGEIVTIDSSGLSSTRINPPNPNNGAACIFEHIYFADPASRIFGEKVRDARERMGIELARKAPTDADLVIAIPNSAHSAAIGFSHESEIPFGSGFTAGDDMNRAFIMPMQQLRTKQVRRKMRVNIDAVSGKRLVVVEDSIVRGTTTKAILSQLRQAGATEIHLRVASPPIRHGCYFGIDFPDESELLANDRTITDIRDFLEVDSLAYLSVDGMLGCVNMKPEMYCTACFTGKYPISVPENFDKFGLERQATTVR